MNRISVRLAILMLVLAAAGQAGALSYVISGQAAAPPSQTVSSNVEDLVRRSRFIFKGRVQQLHASNLKALSPTDNTALVRVEEVLYAPSTLNDFTGLDITVQTARPGSPQVAEQAIFFTNGWLYGESIAVIEVAHTAARATSDEIRKQIADVHGKIEDEKVQSRITQATLIIAGRVRATRALEGTRAATEHDPEWWQAEVEVTSTEKGEPSARELVILFPNSKDEMWLDSPKFKTGDQGILILRRDQQEWGFPALRVPGLTALNRLDFQPISELERIRRLVRSSR